MNTIHMEVLLWDVCIVGSGPAAHTAAIYTSRANLNTVLYEGWMANGIAAGGQLTTTTEVENFPGFPEGIMGPEFTERLKQQSTRFGTKVITETVVSIKPVHVGAGHVEAGIDHFVVTTEDGSELAARSVIIATGASAKTMEFPGSSEFWNKGISACAVCDGAAPIFRNKPIAVIGGGDSAMEEALFLTKYASEVYIIHRRDQFRASVIMQNRVLNNPKIKVLYNHEVLKAEGEKTLEVLTIQDVVTKTVSTLNVAGLFYAIGHKPASEFVKGLVDLDEQGYIVTKPGTTQTSLRGLFAAGDVQDKKWRQAITAAGSGCMAALEAEHYLAQKHT